MRDHLFRTYVADIYLLDLHLGNHVEGTNMQISYIRNLRPKESE